MLPSLAAALGMAGCLVVGTCAGFVFGIATKSQITLHSILDIWTCHRRIVGYVELCSRRLAETIPPDVDGAIVEVRETLMVLEKDARRRVRA